MPRMIRAAPFTTIVLASWLCMLVGWMMGWTVDGRFGFLWQITIMPAYSTFMVAMIVARPLGRWASLPAVVAIVVGVDMGFALLRRIGGRGPGPHPGAGG